MSKKYYELESGTILVTEGDHWENDKTAKRLTQKEGKEKLKTYAREQLLKLLKPGDTVHTQVHSVSKSGMSRRIKLYVIRDSDIIYISYYAACLMDRSGDNDTGVSIGGCGMDMGFALVYDLGRYLFPQGFGEVGQNEKKVKIRARSIEHAEKLKKRGYKFRGRNGDASGWDNDGGYALNQRWL